MRKARRLPPDQRKKERICIITPDFPVIGGTRSNIEVMLRLFPGWVEPVILARKWGETRHRLFDLALSPRIRGWFSPWSLASLPMYELSGFLWCVVLRGLGVRKFLVQDSVLSGPFAALACKLTGGRMYLFDHGSAVNVDTGLLQVELNQDQPASLTEIQLKLMRACRWVSIHASHQFFVHSAEVKKLALTLGLLPERIVEFRFPEDTELFHRRSLEERRRLRTELGVDGSFNILYAGRMTIDKGLTMLVEAFEQVSAGNAEQLRLLLLGGGPLEVELKQRTKSLKGVVFLGSVYDPALVAKWMNAADVFIYPITMSGGVAMAVLEAMACELPVIVGRAGPTEQIIKQGENGFLVPPRVRDISDSLRFLLSHPRARSAVGKRAREAVLQQFTLEKFREDVIEKVLYPN